MTSSASSVDALCRPGVDRNAFTLAIVTALIAGACLGAMTADYGARSTDIGYEPTVFGESIAGALFLGAVLNGIVSLVAFVNARVSPGFFFVLAIGAVSAAPVANGIMSKVNPLTFWSVECTHGNGRACWAIGRRESGIAADQKACLSNGYEERPCERLLERDADHADQYCAQWRAECGGSHIYGKCSVVTSRCSPAAGEPAMDSILDY